MSSRASGQRELAERSVEQLRSSAGWRRWLVVRARTGLRRYSVHNQLLIALQDPDAVRGAGFRAWLNLGWCVRRGEKSHIVVWARCQPSRKRLQAWRDAGADPDERPKPFYKLEPVFSQAQIDPLPPPATPAPLEPPSAPILGDQLAWTLEPLSEFIAGLGWTLTFKALSGPDGMCRHRTKTILIDTGLASPNAQVQTLIHELAHALVVIDHQDGDPELDYAKGELVAESVAFIVSGLLGLDTSGDSIPYLTRWSQTADADAFIEIAKLVDRLAARIEHAIEHHPAASPDDGPRTQEPTGQAQEADRRKPAAASA